MKNTKKNDLFLRACRNENTVRPPVWMMRQAGRFMKEYWEIKNKYSFMEMCKTPEIAADVTMLPVHLLDPDAAILFSDILVTAEAMGGELSFEQGVGPRFANPVRSYADMERLSIDCIDKLQYVAEAIKAIQSRLQDSIPLIGFAGAPFTILSYLVEGGSSKDFKRTKLLLNNEPELAHSILRKITQVTIEYMSMQIAAGVDALQLFDSWAIALSWNDYLEFSHPYNCEIISNLNRNNLPIISFAKGGSVFSNLMAEAKPDVISIDWNADIRNVKRSLPPNIAMQGNLDPFVLYAEKEVIKKKILDLIERMRGEGGYVFDLGHGIMPDMPFENVRYAFQTIKEFRY